MHASNRPSDAELTDTQVPVTAEAIHERRMCRLGMAAQPSAASAYLRAHCAHPEREPFDCLFRDTGQRTLAREELFLGAIDRAEVSPREVVAGACCSTQPPSSRSTTIPAEVPSRPPPTGR